MTKLDCRKAAGKPGIVGVNVSALEELARRCGIEEKLLDARGMEHITTPETKKALLYAMGWNASDEQAAQQSLNQLEDESWQSALPPVFVAYIDRGPVEIPIVALQDAGEVHWTISLEEGRQIEGIVKLAELSLLESRTREDRKQERRTLVITDELPWGYHYLSLKGQEQTSLLIVTPGTCWLPDKNEERRFWGLAVQLYLMRSAHNWGIGDFTDLRELVSLASTKGADVIGLNPLHAMFLDKPGEASPYSPSDRLLLNVLNINIESIPKFAQSEEAQKLVSSREFQERLNKCRKADFVDYGTVTGLKLPVLRLLFAAFQKRNDSGRMEAFNRFHNERRTLLDRACLYKALREYFSSHRYELEDGDSWPEAYKHFRSSTVAEFAQTNAELIHFHLWLQWVADGQLAEAADAGRKMAIGLYRDLAVGAHPQGAEVWSYPESLVSEASIGAPPDVWNPVGQNWGLPPLHPFRARKDRYASFIEIIRANMRHAGALRIDHALALQRLYWIPNGASPKEGAFVSYPTDDLVGIFGA